MFPGSYPATGRVLTRLPGLILLPLIWRVADADKNGCFLFYLACTPVLLGQRLFEVAVGKRFDLVWGFQRVRQVDVDAGSRPPASLTAWFNLRWATAYGPTSNSKP